MVFSFNSATAHATQDWLHATAMTLLRSMNGHQICQVLICLIIMCGVLCWKPVTNWTCKPSTTEELQQSSSGGSFRRIVQSGQN